MRNRLANNGFPFNATRPRMHLPHIQPPRIDPIALHNQRAVLRELLRQLAILQENAQLGLFGIQRIPEGPRGLEENEIQAIPTEVYKRGKEPEVCSICIDEFAEGIEVKRLPCGHIFHINCIHDWITRNPTCPNCKGELRETGDARIEINPMRIDD